MKITIEEKQNEPKRVYPYLGKAKNGIVVAFGSPGIGVAVPCGGPYIDPGFDFIEENFEPMHPQPEPEPKPELIPIEQRKYPYVGKDEFGQSILFTSPKTGMLIKKENNESTNPIGDSLNYWAEFQFTLIPNIGRIIIELD